MSTERQQQANRANAQKSTGPVTPEGKAASSRSRLSHGFFSKHTFAKGEAPDEFWALLADFMTEHQPATPTEQVMVEKMAQSQWVSLRSHEILIALVDCHNWSRPPSSAASLSSTATRPPPTGPFTARSTSF